MGRVKTYDEAAVLEKAMFTFWKNGYEQTSIRMLEKEMGINQFSIYASFKNKENLFSLALAKYKAHIEEEFLSKLSTRDAGLDDIRDFLLNFSHAIQVGKIPNGCLMVNASAEIENEDVAFYKIIKSYFDTMENTFCKVLTNARDKGELDPNIDVGITGRFLLGIAQSISILSKTLKRDEIEGYVNYSIAAIR